MKAWLNRPLNEKMDFDMVMEDDTKVAKVYRNIQPEQSDGFEESQNELEFHHTMDVRIDLLRDPSRHATEPGTAQINIYVGKTKNADVALGDVWDMGRIKYLVTDVVAIRTYFETILEVIND